MRNNKICLALVFCIVFMVSGSSCNANHGGDSTSPPIYDWVSVRSLDALEEMRSMIECDDTDKFDAYVSQVHGCTLDGTPVGKEDLIRFVTAVDAIPYVELLDGEIVYIFHGCYESSKTGEPVEWIQVNIQADNGDSVGIFYWLSTNDIAGKINEIKKEERRGNLLKSPLSSQDGKVIFHVETRKENQSEPGEVIHWYGEVDGIYTDISYCISDARKVDTEALLSNLKITSLSPNQEQ